MNSCCSNCSSSATLGNDLASICTECASVSLGGASLSPMALALGSACVVLVFIVWRSSRRSSRRMTRLALG